MGGNGTLKGIAVFHDHGSHVLSPFLKKGFKHVFACLLTEDGWLRIDGMDGVIECELVAECDYDLASFYRWEGYKVRAVFEPKPLTSPFVINNCVGLTKAVLGVPSHAWTPWQLYKSMERSNG